MKHVSQFTWEFANRDEEKPGVKRAARPGYEALHLFNEYGDKREIGLGVTNVHVDARESAELVRDRVLYAAGLLGPERIYVNPDCGLRTRSWDVAFGKLRACAEGAALARKEHFRG
jgi:5-methyltetrahydropteroyltriglutamate--homocysteine methyltransferase